MRVAEFLSVPVAVAAIALLLIGRLLPIGLASRVWIGFYAAILGMGWLALIVCAIAFFLIDAQDHSRGEVFSLGAFLVCILLPITAAAIAGSVWRYRIP